jgi:hypothetical protein
MKKLYPKQKSGREEQKQARHTHSVIAALEDLIAVLWDVIDGLSDALLVAKSKIERAMEIAKIARKGPHAYDGDTSREKRFQVRKK